MFDAWPCMLACTLDLCTKYGDRTFFDLSTGVLKSRGKALPLVSLASRLLTIPIDLVTSLWEFVDCSCRDIARVDCKLDVLPPPLITLTPSNNFKIAMEPSG